MSESDKGRLEEARGWASQAEDLFGDGKFLEALPLVTQAIDILEGMGGDEAKTLCANCLNVRGTIFYHLRQHDKALRDFTEAVVLAPNDADAYNNRGNIYLNLKQHDNALRDFTKAIELEPNKAATYLNRGNVYGDLKQYDEALRDFGKAIELTPDDATAYNNRGNAYRGLQQYDNALRDLNRAIELDSENATAYNNRGNVYKALEQNDNALRDYTKAIELNPNNAMAYNNRGNVYGDLKQYDNALSDFNSAIKLARDYANAYINRGNIYRELKQYDNALSDSNKAIELNPQESGYYHNRALVLAEKAYSEQLAPAEIEKTFRIREKAYRKRLGAVEKTIQERRDSLVKLLGWGSGIIAAVVGGALFTYFIIFLLGKAGENGMGFPYILVWASAVLTVLLSGLSYPFINALREAQRDKRQLEIAIEDYFRKGVLMRNVLIGTAEQKPALIAATHEHFANRSTAEFLAETPMPKESSGMLERMLRAARDQQDDTKTPPPPPSDGTPTPGS